MESLRETQKKYCSQAITLSIISGFIFIIIEQASIGKGFILGTLFSILNFILIGETLPYRIGKTKGKTFIISLGSIFFRYLLLSIPIIMGIKLEQFNIFSVVAGIFSIQVILLVDHIIQFILTAMRKN